jgi:hypothetical protein
MGPPPRLEPVPAAASEPVGGATHPVPRDPVATDPAPTDPVGGSDPVPAGSAPDPAPAPVDPSAGTVPRSPEPRNPVLTGPMPTRLAPTDPASTDPAPTEAGGSRDSVITSVIPSPVAVASAPTPDPAPDSVSFSELVSTPGRPGAQPVPESAAGLRNPESPSATADDLEAAVARQVADLLKTYSERVAHLISQAQGVASSLTRAPPSVLGALIGHHADGVTNLAEALTERAADVLGGLVGALSDALGGLSGGHGNHPASRLIETVADVASRLVRALGHALGALLGGGAAPAPASNLMTQPLDMTQPLGFSSYSERVTIFIERTTDAVGGLVGALLGSGEAPHQSANKPGTPPLSSPPAVPGPPGAPGAPAPASYSSFIGASGSSADAFQLLFAILLLFSIALLQGGKLLYRREPLRPRSALRLAVERPG